MTEVLVTSRGARIAVQSLVVLLATGLSVAFFGFCLPFFLLAAEILPSLGVAGVVYVLAGGVGGLLFGGISTALSLRRSARLVTPYCARLIGGLSLLTAVYVVAYLNVEWLQRHL